MTPYIHSALAGNSLSEAEPLDRVELPSGVAFTFDVTQGFLPSEYDACDIIFSAMPWRAGYEKFNHRAGVVGKRDWPQFVAMVSRIITGTSTPIALLWGKHVEANLPPWDWAIPAQGGFVFYGWRLPRPLANGLLTREQILIGLCEKYSCIGDFCCGYGETGSYAESAGKHFVLSDFNSSCIGEIWKRLA